MTVVRGLCEVRRDCRTDPDEAMASVVLGLGMRYVAVRVRADRAPQRKDAEMAQQKSEKFIRSASQAARSHAHAHGL